MRKLLSSILLLSLLVMGACQDDIKPEINNGTDGHPVFHVSIADEDVRTGFTDSFQMEWAAGDQISIKCGDATAIYAAKAAGTSADFEYVSGDMLPEEGSFEAYYPASLAEKAVLPAEQIYVENNIAASPMRAVSSNTNLTFKHLCGILELILSTSDSGIKVGGIALESSEGMSGGFTLNGDAARISSDAGNVNMEIADSLALGSTAEKIYLAVPEGTYATGTKFIVKTNKGWRVFSSNKALTFTRACITPATLTVAESAIYKFRTSTDAGKTWTYNTKITAATSAVPDAGIKSNCIVEMLADFSQTAQWSIANKRFTFDGLGHTITVSSLENDRSINPTSDSDITFKNVTFKGPGTSSSNNLMRVESGNTVTLDCCIVKDFNYSKNGGALWLQGTLNVIGKSRIENCCATGTYGGGAIFSENGNVTIGDDVTISGCSSSYHAGAIYMYGKGNLTVGSATIENCKASGYGGAIVCGNASNGVGSTIAITGATISGCSAKDGGFLSATCGTSTFDGVTISGCTNTGNGGSVYMIGGTVELKNSVINGGNSYVTTAGTLNITNSTYTYTGTGYALSVEGTSSTANKGTISVNGNSVIKATSGSGAFAKYGKFNLTNSTLIANGSYGAYINTCGIATFTDANVVNKKDSGNVFYSGTGNANSSLTVNSGYYSGSTITGWYSTGSNNRIVIKSGYFSNNNFNAATQYDSTSLQAITPVTREIDGTDYSFPWHAASTPAGSGFNNPEEITF